MTDFDQDRVRLDKLEADVEHIKNIQRFTLASDVGSQDHIAKVFNAREGSVRLYLALLEKPQNQDNLMKSLKMSRSNVSKICTHLYDAGFIKRLRLDGGHFEYTLSEMEHLLKISKIAKKIAK